ncbi:Hpt domain-containing protein [Vibrio sp. F13]|uniref:Hpt domain-containing protein n=1 Tax=Vibrio sp. F13 TaxID=2070777 RepID=UPI001484CDEC|nr:Hpt domain-containing protein [Vibrio sp. F13]
MTLLNEILSDSASSSHAKSQQAQRIIHQLAGSCNLLGFFDAGQVLQALELTIEERKVEVDTPLLYVVKDTIDSVHSTLCDFLRGKGLI